MARGVIDVIKIIREVEGAVKEKIDEANIAARVKELDVRLTETADKLVATDAAAGLRIDINMQIVKSI